MQTARWPMTSEEKAALVLADPAALWAVLNAGVKVAGPWGRCPGASGRERRRDGHVEYLAWAVERDGWWTLQLEGEWGVDREFSSREEAEAGVDARLRDAGWLLVDTLCK